MVLMSKDEIEPLSLSIHIKNNFKWNRDLNIKDKTRTVEETIKEHLHDFKVGKEFLNKKQTVLIINDKIQTTVKGIRVSHFNIRIILS